MPQLPKKETLLLVQARVSLSVLKDAEAEKKRLGISWRQVLEFGLKAFLEKANEPK
jgi:hypothetical protein